MDKETRLKQIAGYINKMPSLPISVTKVIEICNDPRTSPADLNSVIRIDPVLMGNVMKLINSAYYGLTDQVTSLVRAIIMLGINTVKNLSLSTAILGTLSTKEQFQALNMDGFWRHSLCVGAAAKLIAKHIKVDQKNLESYFIAGLLHDIGKIPLNNKLPEEYLLAISISDRKNQSLVKSETEAMEINHTESGHLIVHSWKLGEEIKDAVVYHHTPEIYEGKNKEIVFAITAANYFSNYFEIGFSGDRYPEKPPQFVFDELNVTIDWFEEIEDSVNAEIDKAKIFLNMKK
jgi:putative nucleotidyltransferase with HDIG domain